jgi:hypothetical protein
LSVVAAGLLIRIANGTEAFQKFWDFRRVSKKSRTEIRQKLQSKIICALDHTASAVVTLFAELLSLVQRLITKMSAAGCFEKSQTSGLPPQISMVRPLVSDVWNHW